MKCTAFIAGATGYTGREVTRQWAALGHEAVAHVRPDSPRKDHWTHQFTEWGATPDSTPWTLEHMTERLQAVRPTHIFALLGTTAKRTRRERKEGMGITGYDGVDYGLSVQLLQAAQTLPTPPRFIYLSSIGVDSNTRNAYLEARWKVEEALRQSNIPHIIARPSFITGSNRDEFRVLERMGAIIGDGVLGGLAAIGLKGPKHQWGSVTNQELAQALITFATQAETERRIVTSTDIAQVLQG